MRISEILFEDWVSTLTRMFLNSEKNRKALEKIRNSELNHDEQRRAITKMAQDAATKGGYPPSDSETMQDLVDNLLGKPTVLTPTARPELGKPTVPTPKPPYEGPIPKARPEVPDWYEAVKTTAPTIGVLPEVLKQIIRVESNFDPKKVSPSGTHVGATQISKDQFPIDGITLDEYENMSLGEQIKVYPKWLELYSFSKKFPNFSSEEPAMQGAILQAFQFSPNGKHWQHGYRNGDYDVQITNTQQAEELYDDEGNLTLNTIKKNFAKLL